MSPDAPAPANGTLEPALPPARSGADRSLSLRPTWAEVDLDALTHNFRRVRAASPATAVLAVVKANAYGHGAVACGRVLEREGAQMLGVALVEEGIELRRAGIGAPILVLGGTITDAEEEVVAFGLTPVVYRPDQVGPLQRAAAQAGKVVAVHLKLETGMGRIGAPSDELEPLIRALREAPALQVDGVLSHFANADLADQEMTRLQLRRFRAAHEVLRASGFAPRWRHLSNSAGVLALPEAHDGALYNMVRPGIMLYGEVPAEAMRTGADLLPVLSWKTRIVHLKRVPAGTPISYGGRWVATRESLIATLPVGYADGYNRRFTRSSGTSQGGTILVRGQRAPISGTVCMDMCMADVTAVPGAAIGDEVVLIGRQGAESLSAGELAATCGTISYEVFCAIAARVPRVLTGRAN